MATDHETNRPQIFYPQQAISRKSAKEAQNQICLEQKIQISCANFMHRKNASTIVAQTSPGQQNRGTSYSNPRNLLHGILIHECPLSRQIAPGLNSMPPAMPHQVQLWNHLPARLVVRNGKCSSFVPGLARIIGKHRPCGLDCSVAIPKRIQE